MSEQATHVAETLRDMRRHSRLSAKDIALQLGVSDRAIYNWETGRAEPSISKLEALSEVFSCSLTDFFENEDSNRYVFTSDEFELINLYRSLNGEGKVLLTSVARGLRDSMRASDVDT